MIRMPPISLVVKFSIGNAPSTGTHSRRPARSVSDQVKVPTAKLGILVGFYPYRHVTQARKNGFHRPGLEDVREPDRAVTHVECRSGPRARSGRDAPWRAGRRGGPAEREGPAWRSA